MRSSSTHARPCRMAGLSGFRQAILKSRPALVFRCDPAVMSKCRSQIAAAASIQNRRPRFLILILTPKPLATGLGLSISYSVVKKHGGLLHLESTSPGGSTFAFYLPATDAEPQLPEPTLANEIFSFNHQRVLVMDDEVAIRDLTSDLLGTLGYEVTAVPDGAEALKTYEDAMRNGENFHDVILGATIRGGIG